MLEQYLKSPFKALMLAVRRFDESPHIATGAAKARAISQFHEQLAKVSHDIYREWQLEWSDEIPSEEMAGLIHRAAQMVGFDDEHSVFKTEN